MGDVKDWRLEEQRRILAARAECAERAAQTDSRAARRRAEREKGPSPEPAGMGRAFLRRRATPEELAAFLAKTGMSDRQVRKTMEARAKRKRNVTSRSRAR